MEVDLAIGGIVLFFALLGAFTGAARQIAQLAGLFLAYVCARSFGPLAGPFFAQKLGTSATVGGMLGALLVFLSAFALVRSLGAAALKRLFSGGKSGRDDSLDRNLGFLLGGLKAALLAYTVVCALSFIENNVRIAGKRLSFGSKGSKVFALARRHNVFQVASAGAAEKLARIAKALSDPQAAKKLSADPSYQALRKDARFRSALESEAVKRALETGDPQRLLESLPVLQLLEDRAVAERLDRAASSLER